MYYAPDLISRSTFKGIVMIAQAILRFINSANYNMVGWNSDRQQVDISLEGVQEGEQRTLLAELKPDFNTRPENQSVYLGGQSPRSLVFDGHSTAGLFVQPAAEVGRRPVASHLSPP